MIYIIYKILLCVLAEAAQILEIPLFGCRDIEHFLERR